MGSVSVPTMTRADSSAPARAWNRTMDAMGVLPPDIQPLAMNFLARARQNYSSRALAFSSQALAAMQAYAWPGNIRELQHVVERSVLLAQQEEILESDLLLAVRPAPPQESTTSGDSLNEMTLYQA